MLVCSACSGHDLGVIREQTIDAWAERYILSTDLEGKFAPEAPPDAWAEPPVPLRLIRPGRPPQLDVLERAPKRPRSLVHERARARLFHGFLHHELQAAELMCWAILAYADAPQSFRRGLLRIAQDEIRHMGMYRTQIRRLGFDYGAFPVRDWFWDRIPACETPLAFVSAMGIGFEGGNLEHAARFADALRAAGDEQAAEVQWRVGVEEVAHVRFAVHWYRSFSGELEFDDWIGELPAPLSPMVMRGRPLHRPWREAAGLDAPFLDALERWEPEPR